VGHNAFGPTNNWPVCSLILHCGQLILRKISKIGAYRYQILRLKCIKFTFCLALPQTPLGELTVPPDLCLHLRSLLLRDGGKREWGRKGKGEGRGEVEGGIWPTQKFWCGAPMEVSDIFFLGEQIFGAAAVPSPPKSTPWLHAWCFQVRSHLHIMAKSWSYRNLGNVKPRLPMVAMMMMIKGISWTLELF